MKKLMSMLLTITIVSAIMPVSFASEELILQYVEDYEGYDAADELFSTYTVQESYSRTQISIEESDKIHGKSMKLGLTEDGDNTQIFYNPPKPITSGRVEMEFSINITEKLIGHIYCVDSETGDLFSLLYLDGSIIRVGTNMDVPADWWGSGVKLCEYLPNNWYKFKIVLDIDNNYYNVKCTCPDEREYSVFYRGVKRMNKDMGTNDYGEILGFGKLAFQIWSHREGHMYVDNVSVKEQPFNVVSAQTAREGNMFRLDDEKKFDLHIKNCFSRKMDADVVYSAVTDSGTALFSETETLSLDPEEEYLKSIIFDMDIYDTAMLNITFDDGINEPYTESFPFSCIAKSEKLNDFFGVCSHDTRDGIDDMPQMVDMYSDYGMSYVREDFEWKSIEKDGVLSLPDYYKTFIKNLWNRGIKVLPILAFGNDAYDEGGLPYTKEGIAAFIRYAEFIYDELSPYGVDTFEVWNEADLKGTGFNPTYRSAEDYTELLKATSKALKAKNPNVRIIGGAISSTNDQEWLKTIFDKGGLDAMDILQLHPYKWHGGPEETDLVQSIDKIKSLMKQYGKEKPIWVTELGWYNIGRIGADSDSNVHSKYDQAAYAVRAQVVLQANQSAEKYFYYNMINPLANQNFTEAEFGLVEAEKGTLVAKAAKPSMLAISNMNRQLAGLTFENLYHPNDETYIGKYKSGSSYTYVAWKLGEKECVGIKTDKEFDVYDMYGNSIGRIYPHNGVVNIMLSDQPCYLLTKESNFELSECTITQNNIKCNAIHDDVITYKIFAAGAENVRVETNTGIGAGVENIKSSGDSVSFDVRTDKETEAEIINVHAKVYNGDRLIYTSISSINLYPSQLSVTAKAEPYSSLNLNRWALMLDITNKAFSKKISGTAELKSPAEWAGRCPNVVIPELAGGESATIKIPLPEIVMKSIENIIIAIHDNEGNDINVTEKVSFYLASYTEKPPTVDGKISRNEWKGTWIILDNDNWNADTSNSTRASYTGKKDLYAKVNAMYDEENLYLCADVYDNKYVQPFTGEDILNGDSFVFAVADSNSTNPTQFTQIGCALTTKGTELFRWKSMAWNNDVNEDSCAFVKRSNNHTIYEISIPWAGLVSRPEDIKDQTSVAFAMMINDCDSKMRKGWLEFAKGISLYNTSSAFDEILLGKP